MGWGQASDRATCGNRHENDVDILTGMIRHENTVHWFHEFKSQSHCLIWYFYKFPVPLALFNVKAANQIHWWTTCYYHQDMCHTISHRFSPYRLALVTDFPHKFFPIYLAYGYWYHVANCKRLPGRVSITVTWGDLPNCSGLAFDK